MSPQISRVTRPREQAALTYDRLSRWYDLLAGSFEAKPRMAGVAKLKAATGDIVLEIGFGTGHAILAFARAVGDAGKVYGIDISPAMHKVADERVSNAGLSDRVTLHSADAIQLPFANDYFDKLFMSFTLELFDTPEIPLLLAECYRVLGVEGQICIVALSRKDPPNLMTRLYEWAHEKSPKYVDCRPIYAQHSLPKAGFEIIDATEMSQMGLSVEIVSARKQREQPRR